MGKKICGEDEPIAGRSLIRRRHLEEEKRVNVFMYKCVVCEVRGNVCQTVV